MGSLSSATVPFATQLRLRPAMEGIGRLDWLVERARNGDLSAFEELAERSMPQAYRLAAAMVGEDDARDVVQDALVAAWRELPRLRESDRFEPWLRSIVMNRARNTLRSRRRHPTVGIIEAAAGSASEEPMAAANRRIDIESAFGGISRDQREVLILHYVLDLPLREVAASLDIREGTVKSRLHAGLMALRSRMPGDD